MISHSIIIPVHDQDALTKQCLDALLGATYRVPPPEVIVVDDGSDGATARVLAGYGERVRVVRHGQSQGYAISCNDGAAAARGRHLVFLHHETIPLAGWLDALADHLEAHPEAAVAGSKLLSPDGTVRHCGI